MKPPNVVITNPPCAHCLELQDVHVESKCLFSPTYFKSHGTVVQGVPEHPEKLGTQIVGACALEEGDEVRFLARFDAPSLRWAVMVRRKRMVPQQVVTTWNVEVMRRMWGLGR